MADQWSCDLKKKYYQIYSFMNLRWRYFFHLNGPQCACVIEPMVVLCGLTYHSITMSFAIYVFGVGAVDMVYIPTVIYMPASSFLWFFEFSVWKHIFAGGDGITALYITLVMMTLSVVSTWMIWLVTAERQI